MQPNNSGGAKGGLLLLSSLLILQYVAAFQAPRSLAPVSSYRSDCSSSHSRHGCIISAAQFQQQQQRLRRHGGGVTTLQQKTDSDTDVEEETKQHSNVLSQAYHLYVDYFDRLWSDTDTNQRQKRARQRAQDAVLRMKNMVQNGLGDEYLWSHDETKKEGGGVGALLKRGEEQNIDEEDKAVFSDLDEDVRRKMEEACDLMLVQLDGTEVPAGTSDDKGADESTTVNKIEAVAEDDEVKSKEGIPVVNEQGELVAPALSSSSVTDSVGTELTTALTEVAETATDSSSTAVAPAKKEKKKGRSVLFGATMGLVVAGWVYSGNISFTALFTLMTALGQLEYYRMVMNTGIYPARRISVVGACATFITALFAPDLHQIVLPVFSTWTMIWFLTMRRNITTISEIATTFTGMFYLGYIPSFWVRIRQLGADVVEPTRLMPLVKPLFERLGQNNLLAYLPKKIHYPITTGSNFIFWTWLCIAFSDVGGYFAGRKFGKTKLGAISPAAGKTSPNKTVEGVIGGCTFSLVLATLGAWIQKWPYWYVLGPLHGVILALLGLVGDLTASMLKRDAGLKDFGDLIPEHGGIMDRVDSYIFTAPYGWLMCGYVIPALKKLAEARAAVGVVV
ncbi:phosphatidate cytidylyltransferase [Skeletonema marinoi]|uniref:Phosphatidate cytidylyltransferase n=2 Tax=Skeletonema marinoi TaxID=267567 RepID=A0AAD9DH72_9STRA|nr:phosphatidate cytidylyltransferase [Skeletonema marinoi]